MDGFVGEQTKRHCPPFKEFTLVQQHSKIASTMRPSGSSRKDRSAGAKERLMMTHMELENFLSFPGCQKIGPFHKRFSIRELNDGGKVNLIDALSFVLGKRARQPELNKTSELIFQSPRYPSLEYCRVSVHFQLIIDDESSEEVYEVITDSSFVVTRVAYLNNQTEYMLDNRSSRLTNLGRVFMQRGVDLENNRYLFLHGDVTKVPALRPTASGPQELGLLDFLEEIFGPEVTTQQDAVQQGRIATPYNNGSNSSTPYEDFGGDDYADPMFTSQDFDGAPSLQQLPFDAPKDGETGIQRLVDKVVNEFQQNCDHIQVSALDGNGDSFQVFQGPIRSLASFHFATVLRHPGCFYFFSASAIPSVNSPDLEDSVVQRDICWLTDPAPPTVQARSHNTLSASWPFVSFCGIAPPAYIDSVQYILEIAQGVEYRPGYFTRFISDVCAVDYRTVCAGPNINSTTIQGLVPSRWYHLRLSIEYLGQRFVSESQSIHTPTWVPSPPGMPRVTVLPVLSSFDLQSDVPVRLEMMISWNPSSACGQNITTYQCQIQKFNEHGHVVQGFDAVLKKEKRSRNRVYYQSPERDPRDNQWTKSPGRNQLQIHNSIVLAERSPTRGRTSQARRSGQSQSQEDSPDKLPGLDSSYAQSGQSTIEGRRFKWEIIFENILTNVKCGSPEPDHAEWHIRARSRNANGWSDFSPILKINGLTHPSLFVLPPPMYAYGTSYYSEHASSQYLDGTENEEFNIHSMRSAADTQPETGYLANDGINVRNELFLNHRSKAEKIGTAHKLKSPSKKITKGESRKEGSRKDHNHMDAPRPQRVRSESFNPNGGSGKNAASGNSAKEQAHASQAPQKLHVLHFKQGNDWGNPDHIDPAAAVEVLSHVQATVSQKKSESLPHLGAQGRNNSHRALFHSNH